MTESPETAAANTTSATVEAVAAAYSTSLAEYHDTLEQRAKAQEPIARLKKRLADLHDYLAMQSHSVLGAKYGRKTSIEEDCAMLENEHRALVAPVADPKRDAAVRTLERAGYTHRGGEEWAPPYGLSPATRDAVAEQVTRLETNAEMLEAYAESLDVRQRGQFKGALLAIRELIGRPDLRGINFIKSRATGLTDLTKQATDETTQHVPVLEDLDQPLPIATANWSIDTVGNFRFDGKEVKVRVNLVNPEKAMGAEASGRNEGYVGLHDGETLKDRGARLKRAGWSELEIEKSEPRETTLKYDERGEMLTADNTPAPGRYVEPTVGRRIWMFLDHSVPRPQGFAGVTVYDGQPMDAGISFVEKRRGHYDYVTVSYTDHDGTTRAASGVPLRQAGQRRPNARAWVEWMPYQQKAAAK
jgi:hypothetical protein